MLRLIAYDIASPKRWRRIASLCEDYGIRVQYSLFECWLDDSTFEELWSKLAKEMDEEKDRIAVYVVDAAGAEKRKGIGESMQFTHKRRVCYVVLEEVVAESPSREFR